VTKKSILLRPLDVFASFAFKWDGKALTLAKMNAPLAIRWHRCLPKGSQPSSVTISEETGKSPKATCQEEKGLQEPKQSPFKSCHNPCSDH
jgi:hypothetical protein